MNITVEAANCHGACHTVTDHVARRNAVGELIKLTCRACGAKHVVGSNDNV